jgi:anti-anti-sigma factor
MSDRESADTGRLQLSGELDVAVVPEVRAQLVHADGDIELDCGGLTFIDASGVNLFVELDHACQRRGATLTLIDPPPCVTRLLDLCELAAILHVRHEGSVA